MDNQLSRFYSICKEGKPADVEKILKDDLSNFSEDEIKHVGRWGIIVACTYGNGGYYPMLLEKKMLIGQRLTEKFIPNAKCLHESFFESCRFVKSTDKFDYVKPNSRYVIDAKYNINLNDQSGCLMREYKRISVRPEIKSRCDDFLKLQSRLEPFEITMNEILDKYVKEEHIIFKRRSWQLIDKSPRTEVRYYYDQDPDHFYKISVNIHLDLHYLRVPYGDKLRKLIEKHNLHRIKIVEESLICLTNRKHILQCEDDMARYFIVKSKIENIMTRVETAVFIGRLSIEDQMDMAHQLCQLIFLSGFTDASLDNLRIDKNSKKIVIIDTEPWEHLGNSLPRCLTIFHEVASAYGIDF